MVMKSKIIIFLLTMPFCANDADFSTKDASHLAQLIEECGSKNSWNFSIAIVNDEGNLTYFQRNPKAYTGSIASSIEKAKSAANFRRTTSELTTAVNTGRIGLLSSQGIIAIEGGVPLTINNQPAGAVGVSGARAIDDEKCALESIKRFFNTKK